jgi:hypothetical protein
MRIHRITPNVVHLAILTTLAFPCLAGCGSHGTHSVEGKVIFKDGSPVNAGIVEFQTTTSEGKKLNASGEIQPDGTYVLGTFEEDDGAVEGLHRAIVRAFPTISKDSKPDERQQSRPIIHSRYENYATSGLEFRVHRHDNFFTIVVEKPEERR